MPDSADKQPLRSTAQHEAAGEDWPESPPLAIRGHGPNVQQHHPGGRTKPKVASSVRMIRQEIIRAKTC